MWTLLRAVQQKERRVWLGGGAGSKIRFHVVFTEKDAGLFEDCFLSGSCLGDLAGIPEKKKFNGLKTRNEIPTDCQE